jgi:glycosyltransferase involved in cell wall biosynthesis
MNLAAQIPNTDKPPTVPMAPLDRQLASVFTKRSSIAPVTAGSVGILSTYPPTQCGLATFASSLRAGLINDRPDLRVGIIRIGSTAPSPYDADVAHVMVAETDSDSHETARALNEFDVAIIQHEFGIYGGADGEQVLDILESIRVPVVLVAHTVPAHPTINQRRVLESLVRTADAVVTMSQTGRRRLLDDYRTELRKLMLIPHGAPAVEPIIRLEAAGPRPVILTWGLLGPGKGVEWGIAALSEMDTTPLRPKYVVAGQTHPKVLARDGERYRDSLAEHAERQGVSHLVQFVPGYLSTDRLRGLLSQADVVLLPYDSQEQVTSGVLTEALAAGVPVVSTAFPHAVELLADGKGGLLVPHEDPGAIAAALTRIITEPGLAHAMSTHNARLTAAVNWPTVAGQYRQVFDSLLRRSPGLVR